MNNPRRNLNTLLFGINIVIVLIITATLLSIYIPSESITTTFIEFLLHATLLGYVISFTIALYRLKRFLMTISLETTKQEMYQGKMLLHYVYAHIIVFPFLGVIPSLRKKILFPTQLRYFLVINHTYRLEQAILSASEGDFLQALDDYTHESTFSLFCEDKEFFNFGELQQISNAYVVHLEQKIYTAHVFNKHFKEPIHSLADTIEHESADDVTSDAQQLLSWGNEQVVLFEGISNYYPQWIKTVKAYTASVVSLNTVNKVGLYIEKIKKEHDIVASKMLTH